MLEQLLARIRANDPSLTEVDLMCRMINDFEVEALAEALKTNSSVTKINLFSNVIGAAGAQALAEALKTSTSVTTINLHNNKIGDAGAQALAEALKTNRSVTSIDLHENNIGDAGARSLAEALKTNISVTEINLYDNKIGDVGAQALADMWKVNTTVTRLDLHRNSIGDAGAQALAEALKTNISVTEINLYDNKIGNAGAQAMAGMLKVNTTVTYIDLVSNEIGDAGAQALAEALKTNTSVTKIGLSIYNIKAASFQALVDTLKNNTSVTEIDLRGNNIGDSGARVIADAFKTNPSVTKFDLSFNRIGDAGAQALAELLQTSTSLTMIDLNFNAIGDAGAQALAEVLQTNTSVTWINLRYNKIGNAGAQALLQALKVNNSVAEIILYGNKIEDALMTQIDNCLKLNCDNAEKLIDAAKNGNVAAVKKLLAVRVSVNYQDVQGNTALHYAVEGGYQAIIDLLVALPHQQLLANKKGELPKVKAKPEPQAPKEAPLETKEPTKSWHFAEHLLKQANTIVEGNGFALVPADGQDIGKVIQFYAHHPVPGYDLKRVDIIYNRGQNQIFERRLKLLDDRGHPASAAAFAPKWSTEYGAAWRADIDKLACQTAAPYQDPDFPNVKLLPMWHGTKDGVLESLLRTGYANLATTDSGFFGKGIYTTGEAEYAFRVYSQKGPLILNWVAFFSAYPTIDGDMAKLAEKSNYQNYDGHFVPVVPASNKPTEVNYYPTKPNQKHTYTELVVFDPNQCLPRYLVELQPTLPKVPVNLGGSPHSLFFKGKVDEVIYVNLLAAAKYAYENYLSKPYTLKEGKDWQLDWQYQHPTNGKVIPRPNHGLAHTLRKLFYLPSILEHYIAHQKLPEFETKLLRNDIKVMQLALLFFISGRENDLGSQGNEVHFKRFREQSADNFERYVKEASIKLSSEKILEYKEAMRWFDNPVDKGLVKHIRQLLWQCHFIDLIRCLTPEQFNGAIGYVDKNMGQARREQLMQLAQLSIQKTGDRMLALEPKRGYQPDLFVEASSSVESCFNYLQIAYRAFETKLANPSAVPKPGK